MSEFEARRRPSFGITGGAETGGWSLPANL